MVLNLKQDKFHHTHKTNDTAIILGIPCFCLKILKNEYFSISLHLLVMTSFSRKKESAATALPFFKGEKS